MATFQTKQTKSSAIDGMFMPFLMNGINAFIKEVLMNRIVGRQREKNAH